MPGQWLCRKGKPNGLEVTNQGGEAQTKKKQDKLKRKKQNAMVKRAALESALKKDLHELKDNKKSAAEIMKSIVPAVQQKSKTKAGTAKGAGKKKAAKGKPPLKGKTLKKMKEIAGLKLAAALCKTSKAKGGKLCPF